MGRYRPSDIHFRAAVADDERFLYRILEERYARGVANIEGMAHDRLPSFEQHCAHLRSGRYERLDIVSTKAEPETRLGMVYLTRERVGGIFMLEKHWRQGLGLAAGVAFFRSCPLPLTMHVNPKNVAGYTLAEKVGWKLLERTPRRLTYELREPPVEH